MIVINFSFLFLWSGRGCHGRCLQTDHPAVGRLFKPISSHEKCRWYLTVIQMDYFVINRRPHVNSSNITIYLSYQTNLNENYKVKIRSDIRNLFKNIYENAFYYISLTNNELKMFTF